MKIGFIVHQIAYPKGFERVVSGHVQVPLYTMQLLKQAGHDVQLITTQYGNDLGLPACMPDGITMHTVIDGRRRGGGLPMYVGHRPGLRPGRFLQQIEQLQRLVRREQYDVLHLFGAMRMAYLGGLIRAFGFRGGLFLTLISGTIYHGFWPLSKPFLQAFSTVITACQSLADQCRAEQLPVALIRHGIVRPEWSGHTVRKAPYPDRILFWRDPSHGNGADIAAAVFGVLAPRYRQLRFVFAVRPHWAPVVEIDRLAALHANVYVYRFPYEPGITIENLMAEALCVVLPFRHLSVQPQFAVLESMYANTAVVTSAIDSNLELIESGKTGVLTPAGDVQANLAAVEGLIREQEKALAMGQRAGVAARRQWNWHRYLSELTEVYRHA
jgi:glycosyltransferase involved in cell wall biosynthesis